MNSDTALLPTAYLPSIDYLGLLATHRHVRVEQWETYPKQTLRNRCTIMTGNGSLTLSVPVTRHNGNHTMTHDVTVSYQEQWNIRHWRAIVSAYNASPFFLYYRDTLETILMQQHSTLLELNKQILEWLLQSFQITCDIQLTDEFTVPNGDAGDFRYQLPALSTPSYYQVFSIQHGFTPHLSAIDLLFNLGPEAGAYLHRITQ